MTSSQHISSLEKDLDASRFSSNVAVNVKKLRKKAKINKKTFALMVGIGRPFLDKIENGTADPRLTIITKMADALDTTPGYLIADHENDTSSVLRLERSPATSCETPRYSRNSL